ncbi:MAG: hypothetical protein AAGJ83_02285 [Planctomycetota bacterium]
MKLRWMVVVCLLAVTLPWMPAVGAEIVDFESWSLIEDPADPNFSGFASSAEATLSALGGPINEATDIGFASINGSSVATSTLGSYFDPSRSFQIAIDYDLNFGVSPNGFLALGFGIGEDVAGRNSAGITFVTQNGVPLLRYGGAGRVNDSDVAAVPIGSTPTLEGSLFVEYDASNGDITLGAGAVGANVASASGTLDNFQNGWNDEGLVASFFIRSDGFLNGQRWNGGTADAVFSNFRVLSGSATAIPEPCSCFVLCGLTGIFLTRRGRRAASRDGQFPQGLLQ